MTTSTAPASTAPATSPVGRTRPKVGGRQPSEQAIDAAIDSATRLLRLPTFRDRYVEIADAAGREQLSYRAFLFELLRAECDDREQRRATRRVHEAGFPRPKTLDEFDFAANTAINPATINTLAGCGWVSKGQPLCLIGDSGTGKTHLLIGLGTAAAQAGHTVRYVLAAMATAVFSSRSVRTWKQQLGAALIQFQVAELVQAKELDSAVAGDRAGQLAFVGGFDEFVDELRREDVTDLVAGLGSGGAQADEQVALAGAAVADQAE